MASQVGSRTRNTVVGVEELCLRILNPERSPEGHCLKDLGPVSVSRWFAPNAPFEAMQLPIDCWRYGRLERLRCNVSKVST
jgi:hypothetical protein